VNVDLTLGQLELVLSIGTSLRRRCVPLARPPASDMLGAACHVGRVLRPTRLTTLIRLECAEVGFVTKARTLHGAHQPFGQGVAHFDVSRLRAPEARRAGHKGATTVASAVCFERFHLGLGFLRAQTARSASPVGSLRECRFLLLRRASCRKHPCSAGRVCSAVILFSNLSGETEGGSGY